MGAKARLMQKADMESSFPMYKPILKKDYVEFNKFKNFNESENVLAL